jgi:hypothetical protein
MEQGKGGVGTQSDQAGQDATVPAKPVPETK